MKYFLVLFIFWSSFSILFSRTVSLKELVDVQEKFNPLLQSKRKEVKKALMEYRKALKSYFPELNFSLLGQRKKSVYRNLSSSQYAALNTSITQKYYQTVWNYNLSLNGIFYNKSISLQIKQYLFLEKMAKLNWKLTHRDLLYNLLKAYLTVLKNCSLYLQEKENLKLSRLQYQLVKNRLETGIVVKTDLLRAELRLQEEEEKVIIAKNAYQTSLLSLENLVGKYVKWFIDAQIEDSPAFFSWLEKKVSHKWNFFKAENSYEYQLLEIQYFLSKLQLNLARSAFLPTINYNISYSKSDTQLWPEKNSIFSGNITFNYKLLDFGKRINGVKGSKYQMSSYQKQLENLKNQLYLKFQTTKLKIEELKRRLKVLKTSVSVSKENYQLIKNQYNNGIATILDLTDAEVKRNQSKTNFINVKYSYYESLLDFLYSEGELLEILKTYFVGLEKRG